MYFGEKPVLRSGRLNTVHSLPELRKTLPFSRTYNEWPDSALIHSFFVIRFIGLCFVCPENGSPERERGEEHDHSNATAINISIFITYKSVVKMSMFLTNSDFGFHPVAPAFFITQEDLRQG